MSCVERDVHRIALCLVLLAATARADDGDDGPFVAAPGHAFAVGVMGRASHLGGVDEGGAAGNLEFALGSGRFQYFAEALLGAANLEMPAAPAGYIARGGVGVRWLARQFQPDSSGGGAELYLEAITGVERYWWQDGGRLTRPDLGVGVGMQMRAWGFHGVTVRLGSRIVFAPTDRDAALVACRGTGCPIGTSTGVAGLMAGLMVGW